MYADTNESSELQKKTKHQDDKVLEEEQTWADVLLEIMAKSRHLRSRRWIVNGPPRFASKCFRRLGAEAIQCPGRALEFAKDSGFTYQQQLIGHMDSEYTERAMN